MNDATRHRLVTVGRWLFALVTAAVLVIAAARNADQLGDVDLDPQPIWLLAAAPFTLAAGFILPLAWRHVLGAYGASLPVGTALRVWCLSQASRFVPSGLALVASRILLTSREGVARSLAGASLAVEVGLLALWSALLSSWLPSRWTPAPLRVLLAVGAVSSLLALPWLLQCVGRFVPRFPALAPDALRVRHLYEAIGLYGVNAVVRTAGVVLVTASLTTMEGRDVLLVVGAINAATVLGMIGITPAGLGVREGVVAALLADRFGAGTAAALAVVYRAWDFAFELVWIAVALTWQRRQRRQGSLDLDDESAQAEASTSSTLPST